MISFTATTAIKQAPGILGEAASLRWLTEAESSGGLRVVRVLEADETRLTLERVPRGTPTMTGARRIGAALARTHAAGAPGWGAPPPDWNETAFQIGESFTPVVTAGQPQPASWGEFFAEYRVRSYLKVIRDRQVLDAGGAGLLERVARRIEAGEFTSAQPQLVAENGFAAARLHGDLWAGNILWDANPEAPTGGVLIDPVAHGGHAETDLAMLQLFGFPYLREVLAGYENVSPLAEGWRERVEIHQLAPLLLHCVLFRDGYGYLQQILDLARHYQ